MNNKLINDFVNKGVDLLLESNKKLPEELKQRDADLNSKICSSPTLRKWVDLFELSELRDLLNSSDMYFKKITPMQDNLTEKERLALLENIEEHVKICDYCETKVNNDLSFEIDLSFENDSSKLFLQMVGSALMAKKEETSNLEEDTKPERSIQRDEGFDSISMNQPSQIVFGEMVEMATTR